MAKPLSADVQQRIIAARNAGFSAALVANMFQVAERSVFRVCQRAIERGGVELHTNRRGRKAKLAPYYDLIRQLREDQPDATVEQLRQQLPVQVSYSTLVTTLHRLGYTYKKNVARSGAGTPRRR